MKQNLIRVPSPDPTLIKLFLQQQEFKKVNQIWVFFSKPSTGFPSLFILNPYSLQWSTVYDNLPLKPSLPSGLIPSAFLCPSKLTFFSSTQWIGSVSEPFTILPSRKVHPMSLPGWLLLLRSLAPSACLRETMSVHLTSSPFKKKNLRKYT